MADLGTKNLTYGDKIRLQGPMDVTLEYHPDNATTPHAVSASVPAKPVEPPPVDPPPPATGSNILGVDFASRSKTSDAYKRMLAASTKTSALSLSDVGGSANGELLALAFVAAATGNSTARAKVVSLIDAGLKTGITRTLELSRNIAPWAIALNAIGEHKFDSKLVSLRNFAAQEQGSIVACHAKRPNNWGTAAGLARVAIDAQVGDAADLAAAAVIHRGWLGDRSAYIFKTADYGDLSWQADATKPVGINPLGAAKSSQNIDGVLPEDQRRGGSFPSWTNENYVWQSLGEVAGTQFILRASGYPDVMSWSDWAIHRAYARYAVKGYGCSGDDGWQYAAAQVHGVVIQNTGFEPGKAFGWADWLYL